MKSAIFLAAMIAVLSFGTYAQVGPDAVPTPDDKTQAQNGYVRPSAKQRRNDYLKRIFGPVAIVRTVGQAALGTWRNSPEEWGDDWEGFGRRTASIFGENAIQQTTIYALDEALKLDSKFYRSKKRDLGSKVKNAVISPFTARSKSGKRVLGVPRLVGVYTSNVIAAETWLPKRYNYRDGLRDGSISLGFNIAVNLFREFFRK